MSNMAGAHNGNKYTVSDDGTIFKVENDGTINRLAQINSDGRITDFSGRSTSYNGNNKGAYCFFIIVFAIASVILCILYIEADDNYSRLNRELSDKDNEIHSLRTQLAESQSELQETQLILKGTQSNLQDLQNKISGTYPLIITDIKIGNIYNNNTIETNYGNTIYSKNTMYLQPYIEYIGLDAGYKRLMVKWFTPNGSLSQGDSSPSGFSTSNEIYVQEGQKTTTLGGWGNSNKGHWGSGTYRIEIWYGNSCLKSKSFTIY